MALLLARMSRDLAIPMVDLRRLILSAPRRYKEFDIPKRRPGHVRRIAQPAKEIKELQRWLLHRELAGWPVHAAATAYRKGIGIAQNAGIHKANRFLLKMDFQEFFPSITDQCFVEYVRILAPSNWDDDDVSAVRNILYWQPKRAPAGLRLSIGAPTSPHVSNFLLHDFDERVSQLCARCEVTYSRYADDLIFSTNRANMLRAIEKEIFSVCEILPFPRLRINTAKTTHVSKRRRRRVTGLILTNDRKVSLGRDRKRQLRAMVHRFVQDALSEDDIQKLRGVLAFAHDVEPEFLTRLANRYGQDVVQRLLRSSRPANGSSAEVAS